jgi:chemotaxis protein methyltransferase CheR
MTPTIGSAELAEFQRAVAMRLGLRFDDSRLTQLAEVMTRRLRARQSSAAAYLEELCGPDELPEEQGALARELTVGETYFFRHAEQLAALMDVALPERLSARAATRNLRLLSAGCASGEEAYTLAILLRERGIERDFKVTIEALDLNPAALAKASQALYSPWSLRETPAELQQRWFTQQGRDRQLVASIREAVRFHQHNLLRDAPALIAAGSFDIVFCRNVLMYFTSEHATAIVARLARALAAGGFLFLGHAETLRGLSHAFHLRHAQNAFYYQLRENAEPYAVAPTFDTPTLPARSVLPDVASPPQGWVGTWLDTVERSSNRIRQLSLDGATAPEAATPLTPPTARRDLSQSLELLRHERFGAALAALQEQSPASSGDPAALLLRAALLTQQGSAEAELVCHELLRLDDLNAGAHYLLALCLEGRGQNQAAVEHDQIAIYLDAGFAMPHLHLGLMARRRRDVEVARRELEQALTLLESEEPARLLLFAGGFSRSALLALCRIELTKLTGAS